MGAMTALMVGLGAASAVSQITGGMQAKQEAETNAAAIRAESAYNAGVYEQQAGMIEQQKNLKLTQDQRLMRFAQGKHVAVTSAKGLQLSGSALAILNDSMTQMQMDTAITQYNYDVEKYAVKSQGESVRRKGATMSEQYMSSGRTAMTAGIVGGLTSLMQVGFYSAARNYTPNKINTSGGAMTGGKS